MPLPKLMLDIPEEGYSFQDAESVLRAKLGAGPSRQRLDMLGAPVEVEIGLILTATAFQYWRAFYRTTIAEGALPFLIDLLIDGPDLTECEARIIPGTSGLGRRSGDAHFVSMRLEVKMAATDSAFDAALVALFGAYGDDAPAFLNLLAELVNSDFPAALG